MSILRACLFGMASAEYLRQVHGAVPSPFAQGCADAGAVVSPVKQVGPVTRAIDPTLNCC